MTMMTAVFSFGRMNPPTIGHAALVREIERLATREGWDARLFVSRSSGDERNPLSAEQKLAYVQRAFPNVRPQLASTVFEAGKILAGEGYGRGVMVVGEDRLSEFRNRFTPYANTPHLGLEAIDFVAVPRPEGAASATQARAAARAGRRGDFVRLCARAEDGDQIYEAVRAAIS